MVSARRFFSITVMMVVLFFLFQFLMVCKDWQLDYDHNAYAVKSEYTDTDAWRMSEEKSLESGFVAFVGEEDSLTAQYVSEWCLYAKRNCCSFEKLKELQETTPDVLVLQLQALEEQKELDLLTDFIEKGVTVVFSELPQSAEIENNKQLQELLGISQIDSEQVTLSGIKLYEGFLLGGQKVYQNGDGEGIEKEEKLQVPWYRLLNGTTVYMMGLTSDDALAEEDLPPLVWKNKVGSSSVFAVNGDFLSDVMAVGFYQAIMYEAKGYDIYPVVNAQSFSVAGYPVEVKENVQELKEIYGRTKKQVLSDIIFPDLIALSKKSDYPFTVLLDSGDDSAGETEAEKAGWVSALKMLKEWNWEAGLSADCDEACTTYEFQAMANLTLSPEEIRKKPDDARRAQIKTMLSPYQEGEELFSYISNDMTLQSALSDGKASSDWDDLRLRSLETALAYDSVCVNLQNILSPQSDADRWEYFYRTLYGQMISDRKSYSVFDKTTLSQSDRRIRTFLSLDYHAEREADEICLDTTNIDTWFLLRTGGEPVKDVEGGSYEKVENGVYLIHANEEQVKITLEEKKLYFY